MKHAKHYNEDPLEGQDAHRYPWDKAHHSRKERRMTESQEVNTRIKY